MNSLRKLFFLLPAMVGLQLGAPGCPGEDAIPASGLLVLDNSDPMFKDQANYNDHLTCLDEHGKILFRVSGLNNCQTIGSTNKIAVDRKRGWLWVTEGVENRILKYDFKGHLMLTVPNREATSIAVDPDTGNLWVATSNGITYGEALLVLDPDGIEVKKYHYPGIDLTYDPAGKAFWLVGKRVMRIQPTGKVDFNHPLARWCSSSVTVNPKTGTAWIAVREHSQVHNSRNRLIAFDRTGKQLHDLALNDHSPYKISLDSSDGSVWVASLHKGIRHFSPDGRLLREFPFPDVFACEADGKGNCWVLCRDRMFKINADGTTLLTPKLPDRLDTSFVTRF